MASRAVSPLAGLLILFAVCAPPASAQTPPPPGGSEDNAVSKSVEVDPTAGDRAIANRIERILQSTNWFDGPKVAVRDGVVFIDGKTQTQEHRRWAGTLAQNTQGTVAVVNRIAVEADVGSTFGRAGDEFVRLYRQAEQAWPWILLAVVIILVTWLVARLVGFLANRFVARRVTSSLLRAVIVQAFSIPVFLLGVYFVLQVAGLTRLAITVLGGTGLFGIIVGFAFREIAENFLASILLSVRNPFSTGDLIEVAGNTGIVQNLNARSTVLLTLAGNYVQIPNAIVFKSTITNYSSTPSRRATFAIGISYAASTSKAQTLIAEVLAQHPAVLRTPEPLVLVEELGATTINLRVYYWFASATYSPAKINSALLRLVKDALLSGGIALTESAAAAAKGEPVVDADGDDVRSRHAVGKSAADEERSPSTPAEGDLRNETSEICERSSQGRPPEAEENLLKPQAAPQRGI
ncbi:mechanosensitive ion channel domain-containing protein [Rhodopseudomonas palustris]